MIVALDGFETGANTSDVATNGDGVNVVTGYDGIGLALTSSSTNIFTTGRHVFKRFTSGSDTIFGHMAVMPVVFAGGGGGDEGSCIFTVFTDVAGTQHLNAQFDAAGHLILRRGDYNGAILATSTLTIPAVAAWRSLMFKVTISDTVGECIIKVDGVEFINFTGDTRNGGSSTRPDAVGIRSKSGQNRIDDLLINDTTGTANNSWPPGQISIVGMRPAGNGANSALVGSDGDSVNNYQQVDENPFNTTDYNASQTIGARDTYDMSALGKSGTVVGVQNYVFAAKSDAGDRLFKHARRKPDGSVDVSAAVGLSTTYLCYAGPIWEKQAGGADWTPSAVDAHEFGLEVA